MNTSFGSKWWILGFLILGCEKHFGLDQQLDYYFSINNISSDSLIIEYNMESENLIEITGRGNPPPTKGWDTLIPHIENGGPRDVRTSFSPTYLFVEDEIDPITEEKVFNKFKMINIFHLKDGKPEKLFNRVQLFMNDGGIWRKSSEDDSHVGSMSYRYYLGITDEMLNE